MRDRPRMAQGNWKRSSSWNGYKAIGSGSRWAWRSWRFTCSAMAATDTAMAATHDAIADAPTTNRQLQPITRMWARLRQQERNRARQHCRELGLDRPMIRRGRTTAKGIGTVAEQKSVIR